MITSPPDIDELFQESPLYARVAMDFWEFFPLCQIYDEDEKRIISLETWGHVVELFDLVENNRFVILGKSKQDGASVFSAAYCLWKCLTVPGYKIAYISAGKENGRLWLKDKFLFMYDHLPEELKVPIASKSKFVIEFEGLDSAINVWGSSRHPAVGSHYSLVVLDEYDFHRFPEDDYAAVEACTNSGGTVLVISTRVKKNGDSKFYKLYVGARTGENEFVRMFMSCWDRPGRDQAWYDRTLKKFRGEAWRMKESYPRTEEEMLSPIDASAFFNQEENVGFTLSQLLEFCRDPMETRMGHIHVYKRHIPGAMYVAVGDCAVGQGGDYQSFGIWEKTGNTLDLAVVLHANNIMTNSYGKELQDLCIEYGSPLTAIEANSMGEGVLSYLEEHQYTNLYYRDRKANKRGFYTTPANRDIMLRDLNTATTGGLLVTRYRPMVDEMLYFQRTKRGTIECAKGHDDLVMMAAIAWQISKDLVPAPPPADSEPGELAPMTSGGMFDV